MLVLKLFDFSKRGPTEHWIGHKPLSMLIMAWLIGSFLFRCVNKN